MREENSFVFDEIDERKFAIELLQDAETAAYRLFRKGDEAAAWRVRKECVEVLQNLGFLRRAPIAIDATMTLPEFIRRVHDGSIDPYLNIEPAMITEGAPRNEDGNGRSAEDVGGNGGAFPVKTDQDSMG